MKNRALLSLLTLLSLSTLTACTHMKFPGVYKLTLRQGNYIEQKQVDQLEAGMNKRQVRYILGTPLVQDTFNPNRWDYFYDIKRGETTYGQKHFTVFFENDRLVSWEGEVNENVNADKSKTNQEGEGQKTEQKSG